jgi:uncharacterized protein YcbK (DUF882 family)
MQEAEAKMINFVTEMKIVLAAMSTEETNKNMTLKQRQSTVVMRKQLTIVSSHQNTQKKKRYCRKKSKVEMAARRSKQKKPVQKTCGALRQESITASGYCTTLGDYSKYIG